MLTKLATAGWQLSVLLVRVGSRVSGSCRCRAGRPRHAAWAYSCINPPSRSRRRRQSWDGAAGGGSDLNGATWLSARWGRCWLTCATYSVSTVVRCWRLRIRLRSSSSRRRVPIHRSAIAFAECPHRRAQNVHTLAGEHGIKNAGELAIAIPDQHRELSRAVTEVHDKVACLLGNPGAAGVGGDSQKVNATGRVFHHEQHIQPLQQRVDAEEVRGENAPGLPDDHARRPLSSDAAAHRCGRPTAPAKSLSASQQ